MPVRTLASEYPGDTAWSDFALAWDSPDEDIQSVAAAMLCDQAPSWMQTPTSALGGLSPAEVLEKHPQGTWALRSLLMRLP